MMHGSALRPYERSLRTREPLRLWHTDGRVATLDIERWLAPADAIDTDLLSRARAPVLDVGCGPGRMVASLADFGLMALGIDIARTAVDMTRARGLNALQRSVFAHLPGEGRWETILLLDGNIGIGGDPDALLARTRRLLSPTGRLIIETHPERSADEKCLVRFTRTHKPIGPPFPWAYVGIDAACDRALRAGYTVIETWTTAGRTFAVAQPAGDETPVSGGYEAHPRSRAPQVAPSRPRCSPSVTPDRPPPT